MPPPPKVYRRGERGWDDWSRPGEGFVVHEYKVGDRTVFKDTSIEVEADKDYPSENLRKGDKYRERAIIEAGFEFLKLTDKVWITQLDDSPQGKGKGLSRKNPLIYKYTCKKHDPDKPVK